MQTLELTHATELCVCLKKVELNINGRAKFSLEINKNKVVWRDIQCA